MSHAQYNEITRPSSLYCIKKEREEEIEMLMDVESFCLHSPSTVDHFTYNSFQLNEEATALWSHVPCLINNGYYKRPPIVDRPLPHLPTRVIRRAKHQRPLAMATTSTPQSSLGILSGRSFPFTLGDTWLLGISTQTGAHCSQRVSSVPFSR